MKEISFEHKAGETENEWLNRKKIRSRGSSTVPPVRTFRRDVQDLVLEQGTTKTDVIIAEASRRESRGESRIVETEGSHFGRIIFILLLVLAFGIGIGAYVLIGTKVNIPPASDDKARITKPLSMAPLEIAITGSPREQIVADISIAFGKTSLTSGGARAIVFLAKDADGNSLHATTKELITAISVSHPSESLIRSLHEDYEYGIYSLTSLTGYLTLHSRSYRNTFAGMLEWETNMAQDLVPIVNPWYARTNLNELWGTTFEDERIGSIDARILRDKSGKIILAYAFFEEETLVIAGNDQTLLALIDSLAQNEADIAI